ncbi:MAG: cyclic nucleotide-binding/CBS domain-containing protein [Candidatus Bathyarchaeia archaeon]
MPAVKDIMTKNVMTVDVDKTVFEAAQLMSKKGIGCLVVTVGDVPSGIVTERDFVRRIIAQRGSFDLKVSEIMSKSLVTVDPDASVKDAARLMSSHKIRRLPVLKQGKLVGIVVAADLVRNVGKKTTSEEILEAIGRYPSGPIT